MSRDTKALVLFIAPPCLLMFTLIAYAVISFIITALIFNAGNAQVIATIGNIIRILLGIVGLVGVVGILVGWPFAAYLALSTDKKKKK